jgi:hypothetical protein
MSASSVVCGFGEPCSPSYRTLPWPLRSVRRQLAFVPETPCLGQIAAECEESRLDRMCNGGQGGHSPGFGAQGG